MLIDEKGAPESPADDAAPQQPQAGPDPAPAAGSSESISLDEAKKLRQEARSLRARLAQYEAQAKAQEDAALSETQRATKQATELTAQLAAAREQMRAARLELTILQAAPDYQLQPSTYGAALKLLDQSLLEWDDERGVPTKESVKKALEALVRDNPFLVATDAAPRPPANGAPTNPAATRRTPLTRDQIARMPETEINARWDEVQAVLRQN